MLEVAAIRARAEALGFVACGITDLSPVPHAAQLDDWLSRGYAGAMRYLHRQARKRKNPADIVAGAHRAVVVLDNYYYAAPDQGVPDSRGDSQPHIARYARGEDYHRVTARRLEDLADFLRHNGAQVAKVFVDAGPVPERELAQRAGLGWIGKNTMLIRPGLGSFCFIGSVLTDLPLELDDPFEADRCGSCTRCLNACPTQAFVAERVLDATRCISYLTIEHRGPFPPEWEDRLEGWAFGCDICNDVCPWNGKFVEGSAIPEFAPRRDLDGAGPDFFDAMNPDEFGSRFGDTPLERPGLEGMRRNWRAAQ